MAETKKLATDLVDQSSISHVFGYHMAMAYIPVKASFDKHIGAQLGLSRVEFTILMLSRSNPVLTQKTLAQFLSVSSPTITVLLDKMEQKRWIERRRSQSDRRHVDVSLTGSGRKVAEKAHSASLTYEKEVLRHLTPAEQALLLEFLDRVAGHRRV